MVNVDVFERVGMTKKDGALTPEQIAKVKSFGCLKDKRFDDIFNVRVITKNGKVKSEVLKTVAEAAEKFGSSQVTMTGRLTLEIQGVSYDKIPELILFLNERGLESGGTGAKVRPVVSCKGTTCIYGLIDTYSLSEKVHERFYKGYGTTALPHKFKIAVGGCPNNCMKPDLNDVGIIGQRIFTPDAEKCRGCKKCVIAMNCPMGAPSLKDGKIYIDPEKCNSCGRCHKKCPFGAFETAERGYKMYVGGRWGKKTARGRSLSKIFTSEEEVLAAAERALILFRDEGQKGERFAETIERVGFDYAEKKILGK